MHEITYVLAAILISSAITWSLRAAPFAFLAPMRRSAVLPYLNEFMPPGIMVILVFYTIRTTPVSITPLSIAVAVGLLTTTGLHLWRSNATLSILGGTAAHVILASTIPAWP